MPCGLVDLHTNLFVFIILLRIHIGSYLDQKNRIYNRQIQCLFVSKFSIENRKHKDNNRLKEELFNIFIQFHKQIPLNFHDFKHHNKIFII